MIDLDHNCAEHEAPSFEPLPVGKYPAVITSTEKKLTKDKSSAYLNLTIEIISGPYKGRTVFDMLHLWNKNATAVKIARGTLTQIGVAIGLAEIKSAEQIMRKTLTVSIKQEQYNDEIQNRVKGYSKYEKFAKAETTESPSIGEAAETANADDMPF